MATHVYHWKHGWIPLDHTAALSKAKGNHKAAAKMLEDAHGPGAGIHSREHVAKAALGLHEIPNPQHRAAALSEVHAAADRHNAHDVLPARMQKPTAHPVGSKVEARQPGIDHVTTGEVVGHDAHGMVRVKYLDHRGNEAVGTFNPSHVKGTASAPAGPTGALWRVKAHEVQAGDTLHVPSAMGGSTKRYRVDKTYGPKSDGGVNIDATNLETGRPVELTLQGDKKHDIAKRPSSSTEQRMARADAAMSADAPLTAEEQAVVDAKFAAAAAKRAQSKAAPKSRAKGIVLPGRTDENRYHYRGHDGELQPQNDRVVNRLKRLEATHRKAEREGDVFGAHKARQEFASITGEHKSVITYQPGAAQRGKDAGLPDGYSVKRDVIDGYGPVSTFSAYGPGGKRVGQAYHSPEAASRAAHQHHAREQQREADRVALQQRLADEKAAKAAKAEQTMAEGRAAAAKLDNVDPAEQVATNHLVERMHNSGASMSAGELAKIAGSSHVAQHHRDRAQGHLNEQAARRVQFMEGANDARTLNARLVDARQSMPAGPMRTALIHALEQRLASLR